MSVLTVAGPVVAALILAAVFVAAHRGRGGSSSEPAPPVAGAAFGAVPGHMPGIGPRTERHEVVTSARVDPPHPSDDATVDLDGNLARLRREP